MAFARSQRILHLLFLVDIENDAADMAWDPGLVPDQTAAGANPLSGSVPCANPEPDVGIPAGLGNFPDGLVGALAVVRFEQRKKQLVGYGLFRGDAEQASRGIGPFQRSRGKIEIPGADAKSLHLESEVLVRRRLSYASHA